MTEWKTGGDVKRLTVGRKIGEGYFGKVHVGRIWFHGSKKPIRVAVKRFYEEINPKHYETVIEKLKKAGLPVSESWLCKAWRPLGAGK